MLTVKCFGIDFSVQYSPALSFFFRSIFWHLPSCSAMSTDNEMTENGSGYKTCWYRSMDKSLHQPQCPLLQTGSGHRKAHFATLTQLHYLATFLLVDFCKMNTSRSPQKYIRVIGGEKKMCITVLKKWPWSKMAHLFGGLNSVCWRFLDLLMEWIESEINKLTSRFEGQPLPIIHPM